MPQAIAAWVITTFNITSALGVALVKAGIGLAINFAVAKLTQPKGPTAKDAQSEIRQSDAPRTRYLGNNRVSGAVMYWDVHDEALWKLWAVAQGGHNGVQQWYLDDQPAEVVSDEITSLDGKVNVWARTGRGGQLAGGQYPQLVAAAPEWTTSHRLDGIGTFLAKMDCVKAEDSPDYYPGGEPKITALISGDSVRHPSGAAAAPSSNLARQLYDILIHPDYGVMTADDLDLPSWIQAVADCDDAVPTAGGTRPRFAGGGGYHLSEPIKDVADRWCSAMAATTVLTADGKVGIRVGKWVPPTHIITDEHIVSMEYGVGADQIDGVASLVPKFVSPALHYQETTADPVEDAAAIARWGETAAKELPLPLVQHHGQARALAKIALAKANPRWRFNMRLRFWGLLLLEETAVFVNIPRLGIVNQPFWIDEYRFDPGADDGVCSVSLISADPASFSLSAAEEGTAPAVPPVVTTDPSAAPISPVATVVRDEGTPYIRISAQSSSVFPLIGEYRIAGSSDPWVRMDSQTLNVLRTPPLADNTSYEFRIAVAAFAGPFARPRSSWALVGPVAVRYNPTPPAPPVVLSHSGTAGGTFTVMFDPDLGPNYSSTDLWRGAVGSTFGAATFLKRSYATSEQVTMTDAVPAAGARYWLVSVNKSGAASAQVYVRQAS